MDSSIPNVDGANSGEDNSPEGTHEICASLQSLTVRGTPPAEGDTVTARVEGTISRIDGDRAYVDISKVNGQDVPEDESVSEESPEDAMMKKAAQADSSSYQ